MKYEELTVLGVCGAQGALLHPLRKCKIIGNIEPRGVFHSPGEEQWKINFGDIPFLRSLNDLPKCPKVDILVGSPSCGHSSIFSYSRKKSLGNPKNEVTINLFCESIRQFNPGIWLMENLPKMLNIIPLTEWEKQYPGYKLLSICHSMADFGNSQVNRERLVLIGIRKDYKLKPEFFKKIFKVQKIRRVYQLEKEIRAELNYSEDNSKRVPMYDSRKIKGGVKPKNLTLKEVHWYWNHDYKDEYKWPMPNTKMNTLPGVYRNRKNGYPMTARPSSRQFAPSGWNMGLEEYRVIMGFPTTFKVYMDLSRKEYWLNKGRNTLTKGACYEVGVWFRKCIKNSLEVLKCNQK